ncbi:MAG TPA: patatin-like phospholipase family protein [Mycobacteriales bacterium]|jgi:NTE family protein|nr:patatin-like phospholipase family protein [Mycobacteriales bacterium]
MVTAFVLSGGGSLGAVQVGMLQALAERGVEPDLLVGTSAGALNASYVAGHGGGRAALEDLGDVWRGLRRRDVFPLNAARAAGAVAGAVSSLCSSEALRRLARHHLSFDRLEDASIPLHLVATDVRSGEEVLLSTGDAVTAVMASAAIPAVFPAVPIDGRHLVDGGIADNCAIMQAISLGADRVYVLPGGYACALDRPPATALGSALQALTLLIEQRLLFDVANAADLVDLRLLPPLCPLAVSSIDFRHGGELIDRARATSLAWLDDAADRSPRPERFLSLHSHGAHRGRVPAARKPAAAPTTETPAPVTDG